MDQHQEQDMRSNLVDTYVDTREGNDLRHANRGDGHEGHERKFARLQLVEQSQSGVGVGGSVGSVVGHDGNW
jgi:hypothetical protein